MNNRVFTDQGYTFARVSKNTARRAYAVGLSVVCCPVNLRPFTPWHNEFILNKRDREQFIIDVDGAKNDFNNLVNSIEYYNCINSETGKYCAYYLPVREVDSFTGDAPTDATLHAGYIYDYDYIRR